MSIASKQMFLEAVEKQLGEILTASDTRQAMRKVTDVLSDYDLELVVKRNADSNDCLKAFIDAKKIEGRSEKTIKRYEYILGRFFEAVGISSREVTTYHIRGYLMDNKERGLADRSLEGIRSVMSSYFGWLWKEGLIERNPCANVGAIKCAKKIRLPYSSEDIERLKEMCGTIRDKAIISFLLSTGCRVSEVCALNRDDVDLNSLECKVLGKGNKERTVYFDKVTAMLLNRYILTRDDISPALFIGKGSKRLTAQGMRYMLKKVSEKANVENVHPHRFRRTLATNLIDRGMPIQEVAAVLGHDKIDTTTDYIYIEKENVKSAYRKYA